MPDYTLETIHFQQELQILEFVNQEKIFLNQFGVTNIKGEITKTVPTIFHKLALVILILLVVLVSLLVLLLIVMEIIV